MKKRLKASVVLAALLALTLACGASAAQFGKDEMRRMSVFISNFTEVGLYDFDLDLDVSDLIRFGIRHNYINNYKSRIKLCKDKECPHGTLTIEGKFVVESVKKYFGLDVRDGLRPALPLRRKALPLREGRGRNGVLCRRTAGLPRGEGRQHERRALQRGEQKGAPREVPGRGQAVQVEREGHLGHPLPGNRVERLTGPARKPAAPHAYSWRSERDD
mgnify:CR=1 FL=1